MKQEKPFIWQNVYAPVPREWATGRFWLFHTTFAPNLYPWPDRAIKNDSHRGLNQYYQYVEPLSIYPFSIKPEKKIANVNKFKGDTASPGQAKGEVAIINTPDDMKKMKPGNIIVATTTSPNLMPAIRQAGAIITDEGGLTCHAAIVSRELGIPCVVGVKIATQVLKDGDRVEVNASKGVVKIIK